MKYDKRGVSTVAVLLLVFLLVAIIGVTTLLVGRAMGWWTYVDLPVIGRFFSTPTVDGQGDLGQGSVDQGDLVASLQAELDNKQQTISQLEPSLQQKDVELASLNARVAELMLQLQTSTEVESNKQWQTTAKMLQNMRAEQAAAIVSHYTDVEIMQVLQLMSPETAGGILSNLDPARAAQVSVRKK